MSKWKLRETGAWMIRAFRIDGEHLSSAAPVLVVCQFKTDWPFKKRGVEVLFEGYVSVVVRSNNNEVGKIDARGTADNPIVFRSSAGFVENHEGYYGTWKGISFPDSLDVTIDGYNCTYNSGSILEHCLIEDISDGISGKAYIDHCEITADGYALGSSSDNRFNGVIINSNVTGSIRIDSNRIVFGNCFNGGTGISGGCWWAPWCFA